MKFEIKSVDALGGALATALFFAFIHMIPHVPGVPSECLAIPFWADVLLTSWTALAIVAGNIALFRGLRAILSFAIEETP